MKHSINASPVCCRLLALVLLGAILGVLGGCERSGPAGAGRDGASQWREVRDGGMNGRYFVPAQPGPRPALLVLGGSEGGIESASLAAEFSQSGYTSLALGYFGLPGLPLQLKEIPLEYFSAAIDWLAQQPQVDRSRIAVVGISKGAEAALLIASHDPRVRAVVAATPSAYAWQSLDFVNWSDTPSWTRAGLAVPYVRLAPFNLTRHGTDLGLLHADSLAAATPQMIAAARIPIERSRAAILLIAGQDDRMWDASGYSATIERDLAARGLGEGLRVLRYADAGHAIFAPPRAVDEATLTRMLAYGGTREGTRAALADSWPAALAFLAEALDVPAERDDTPQAD